MIVVVAGRISSILHEQFIICAFLRIVTYHVAFPLLGNDVIDKSFFTLEVIPDSLRFIRSLSILKHRFPLLHSHRVDHSTGIDRTAVHVHGDNFGSQFDALVVHLSISIQMGKSSLCKDNRVIGRIYNGSVQGLFLFLHRFRRQCIGLQYIGFQCIVFQCVDSQ